MADNAPSQFATLTAVIEEAREAMGGKPEVRFRMTERPFKIGRESRTGFRILAAQVERRLRNTPLGDEDDLYLTEPPLSMFLQISR